MIKKPAMAIAGVAAVALAATLAVPGAAGASTTRHKVPVDVAHLGSSTTLSKTHLHPGRVTFTVHSKQDHSLQIIRFRKGYSYQQAGQDIGAAFGGDAAAVRRVDHGSIFYGGAEATKHKVGRFTVVLPAGTFYAVNFDNGAYKTFTVSGKDVKRRTVSHNSRINMLSYGFDTRHSALPRSGNVMIKNISDQPHFIVLQRIKQSTTFKQVKKALESDSDSKPKFALKGSTDSGVLSPYKSQVMSYNLPAGKYVLACFWPDSKTGMEHAKMGMFKVLQLR